MRAPRPRRLSTVLLAALSLCSVTGCHRRRRAHGRTSAPTWTRVETLASHRRADHAFGRTGDRELVTADGLRLTVATVPDGAGHRPLQGAILDVRRGTDDRPDPLLWWRPVWVDSERRSHPLVGATVRETRCADRSLGLAREANVDGVTLRSQLCATGRGRYRVSTTATNLPAGAALADDINPGSASVLVEGRGEAWEGTTPSRWVALAEHGTVLLFESAEAGDARRNLVHIAGETFPNAVTWLASGASSERRLTVLDGDLLDALARVTPADRAQVIDLHAPPGSTIELVDDAGAVVLGPLPQRARLVLPLGLGASLRLRDGDGIVGAVVPLGAQPTVGAREVTVVEGARATVRLSFADALGVGLPVHVMFAAVGGDEPRPVLRAPARGHASGRSVYLLGGEGEVRLAPGTYRITASRGPGWTLHESTVTFAAGEAKDVRATLRPVIEAGWIAADFHLHASPSPDSRVTLDERVASLACNGVGFAVASDHNRITDYTAAVHRQGLDAVLTTVVGDEVTSQGTPLWGHFNAFPLPAVTGTTAPEDAAPAYYGVDPQHLFAAARAAGATILQVNHPRMPPSIGYFDLTHFDAATGRADAPFAEGFDAVEAFNGIWLETPAKVREGAMDLVGLARRGMRVTATGNSDSHRLVYEEAGYPRTWVHVGEGPAETLTTRVLEALRRGDTTLSSGPFVTLETIGRVRRDEAEVRVRVTAPAWVPVERVELWRDDEVVQRWTVTTPATDGVRFEATTTVALNADAVLTAWAEADAPLPDVLPYPRARAIGFTSPRYIDRDNDGRVVVPPR